jgi:glycosyltransferase involved in cell wall biosynthesis/phosphoheptose isomerase
MSRRIAMISEHASPLATLGGVDAGGQNVYVAQVARALAALGDRVDVFTRRDDPSLPPTVDFARGVRVIHVPAGPPEPIAKEELLPAMGEFATWMRDRFRRSSYDLVHANFFYSGLVAAELKEAVGTPFVITFHALGRVRRHFQGTSDRFPDERFAIEDRIVAQADRIIAECPQDEEDLIRLYNADPERIAIVPCGFDPSEFEPMSRPLARMDLGLDPTEPVLLQLGRMVPRKGVDNVVRALSRLERDHGIRARLLVVGGASRDPDPAGDPELGRLAGIAREEGVAERVTLVGRRDRNELKAYYNAADIFVSTPWYEPFGITPLEAMACGIPVVGSRVGGIKFSVRDGETGYLVPPDDPAALAERIAHLYKHPKLLSVLGQQARRRVNDLFTWERVANGISGTYEEVLLEGRLARTETAARLARIDQRFEEAVETLVQTRRRSRADLLEAADEMTRVIAREGKLLIAGNGASAAAAQHWASNLVGRFMEQGRPGLPALALGTDPASLTAWSNDVSFEDAFARQVEALGRRGDLLIGLSTTGRSRNLIRAFERARAAGISTLALLGGDGGQLTALADHVVIVPSRSTQHIQEAHDVLIHILCELVEGRLADAGWFSPVVATQSDGSRPTATRGRRSAAPAAEVMP